jgi:hypothetical protein
LLNLPLHLGYTSDFPIIQYADDTFLIMESCPRQLFVLKVILNTFADSTGLKVNYSKSMLVPINISQERLAHLAATFQCREGSLPFTYLGLPLSNHKPNIQDCLPLAERVERRLVNTSIFLTQGGKLELSSCVPLNYPLKFLTRLINIEGITYEMVVILMLRSLLWLCGNLSLGLRTKVG